MTEEKFDGDVPGGLQSFWLDQIKELQKDNSLQKDLAEKRDNMLFDYGNKVVECNSLESLYKLKVSVKRFKTITIQTKKWKQREPEFTYNGVTYYRESYESKTYEEIIEELDAIIENIDVKIKMFEICQKQNENIKTITDIKLKQKLESPLSDEKLVEVCRLLIELELLGETDVDLWLSWFNRKHIKSNSTIKWEGSKQILSNVIQHICGSSQKDAIMAVFGIKKVPNPQKRKYMENTTLYDRIESILQK